MSPVSGEGGGSSPRSAGAGLTAACADTIISSSGSVIRREAPRWVRRSRRRSSVNWITPAPCGAGRCELGGSARPAQVTSRLGLALRESRSVSRWPSSRGRGADVEGGEGAMEWPAEGTPVVPWGGGADVTATSCRLRNSEAWSVPRGLRLPDWLAPQVAWGPAREVRPGRRAVCSPSSGTRAPCGPSRRTEST